MFTTRQLMMLYAHTTAAVLLALVIFTTLYDLLPMTLAEALRAAYHYYAS